MQDLFVSVVIQGKKGGKMCENTGKNGFLCSKRAQFHM